MLNSSVKKVLEQAALTLLEQALGTVAHAVSHNVWCPSSLVGSSWLLVQARKAVPIKVEKAPNSSTFASALLGAMDDDLDAVPPPAPPATGGLLGSLFGESDAQQQVQMNMQLGQLTGIYSVYVTGQVFENDQGDGTKTSSMIQLAREEELERYSHTNQSLLQDGVQSLIIEWCGSLSQEATGQSSKLCLQVLCDFFQFENYELNSTEFSSAEADE